MADTRVESHDQAERHDPVYDRLHATPEFQELKKRHTSFVLPATIAFLSWYLLYVVMSMWAHDFMSRQVVGNINVAPRLRAPPVRHHLPDRLAVRALHDGQGRPAGP